MKTIFETDTHKIEIPDGASVSTVATKIVGLNQLGEELPDAVLLELKVMEISGSSAAKKQAASRVLTRIHSNVEMDAYSPELATLLSKLVTHTALTQTQSNNILAALQG